MSKRLREENRKSWNAAIVAHNRHKGDQARFFRKGGDTLYAEEVALLGDVRGKRLVHLQCNAGQDTLSLARRGAKVTGVDLSDEGIAFAQKLSEDSGVPGRFVRADVFDWLKAEARSRRRYDVAFASYGALCWLPELESWAKGVAGVLARGGVLVVMEFHPAPLVFDEQWRPVFPYWSKGKPITNETGVSDYVATAKGKATTFKNPHRSHEFQHPISDVLEAVLRAGLVLEEFREYPYANYAKMFDDLEPRPGLRWVPPKHRPQLPMMYGLRASRR